MCFSFSFLLIIVDYLLEINRIKQERKSSYIFITILNMTVITVQNKIWKNEEVTTENNIIIKYFNVANTNKHM